MQPSELPATWTRSWIWRVKMAGLFLEKRPPKVMPRERKQEKSDQDLEFS